MIIKTMGNMLATLICHLSYQREPLLHHDSGVCHTRPYNVHPRDLNEAMIPSGGEYIGIDAMMTPPMQKR